MKYYPAFFHLLILIINLLGLRLVSFFIRAKKYFLDLRLINKLVILYGFISIVMLLSIIANYLYSVRTTEKEISSYSSVIVQQLCLNAENLTHQIENEIFGVYNLNVLLSKNLGQQIKQEPQYSYENTVRRFAIKSALDEIVYQTSYINWVAAVDLGNNIYTLSRYGNAIPYDLTKNNEKNKTFAAEMNGNVRWEKQPDGTITMLRMVYNITTMRYTGYIIVDIDEHKFDQLFQSINPAQSGQFVIYDSTMSPMVYTSKDIVDVANEYIKNNRGTGLMQNIKLDYNKQSYMCVQTSIYRSNLPVVNFVNMNIAKEKFNQFTLFTLSVSIIALLAVTLVTMVISRNINKNIKLLVKGIARISEGELETVLAPDSLDEIGQVSLKVNVMAGRILELLSQVKEEEEKQHQVQYQMLEFKYKALQAQINPHFLFNVLESINGIAKLNDSPQVSSLVCKLAKFLRGNIERSEKFCSLSEELEYLDNYLAIYREMYGGRLSVEYDIDEELLSFPIPSFILQPIVENAVVHGIEPKVGNGRISISAKDKNDHIVLTVTDDGVGIPDDRLELILSQSVNENQPKKRLGLNNVRERIKLIYGIDHDILIVSKVNQFTSIVINLPKS